MADNERYKIHYFIMDPATVNKSNMNGMSKETESEIRIWKQQSIYRTELSKPEKPKKMNIVDNFSINGTTGEIYVQRPLDRDRPNGHPIYKLLAYAQNVKTKEILAQADIIVHLRDINDNQPFFPETIYNCNVTENGPSGINVIQMKAIDYDFNDNDYIDNDYYMDINDANDLYEHNDSDEDEEDEENNSSVNGEFSENIIDDKSTIIKSAVRRRKRPKLIYSIKEQYATDHLTVNNKKNNIRPIFAIDSRTGWITTIVCCLDREQHYNYTLLVVVEDSAGFKVSNCFFTWN